MPQALDPQAVALAKAIRQTESGGNFQAAGKSGEYGAYQFTEPTWNTYASKYGVGVPLKQATPEQQNEVAYKQIKEWKDQGLNVGQIASMWNSGKPDAYQDPSYKGVNKSGAQYDVPAYAKSVATAYQTLKQGGQVQADPQNPSSTANTSPVIPPSTSGTPLLDNSHALGFVKDVGNFFFPVVKDVYHDIKGDNQKTALQQVGDLGLSALSVLPGIGQVGKLAQGARLGVEASAAAKTAGLLPSLIKGAATGYGVDVSSKLAQGQTDPSSVLTPGIATIAGGVLGGVGGAASKKLSTLASQTAETRLAEQANRLKTLQNSLKANTTATTNPLKTLTEQGFTKELKVVNGKVDATALANSDGTGAIDNAIASHADDASAAIKSLPGGLPTLTFKEQVLQAVRRNPQIVDAGGVPKAEAEIERIFKSYQGSYGDSLPWTAVDSIRKRMNREFSPELRDVSWTVADAARNALYTGSGTNKAIQSAMANESELIKARNFVERLHGTTIPGGQMGKYFADIIGAMAGTGVGTAIGGPLGGGLGTLAGGYAANKAMNIAQGNYFNPILAGKAGALQKLLQNPATQSLKQLGNVGLLRQLTGGQ